MRRGRCPRPGRDQLRARCELDGSDADRSRTWQATLNPNEALRVLADFGQGRARHRRVDEDHLTVHAQGENWPTSQNGNEIGRPRPQDPCDGLGSTTHPNPSHRWLAPVN
jgi:hypothetical protein